MLRAGDVVGGRWRLLAEAPANGPVRRYRAVAVDTGEPAEVLSLRPGTSPEGRRAFAQAHRQLRHARDPALNPTLDVLEEGGGPIVVRAPLEDPTFAEIPGPLPATLVASVGARLVPAVLAAGAATGGALLPQDVGLDARGQPVLAPQARPLSHVDRAVQLAVAPECFDGALPDGASGLYGLGMLLYELATGRKPQRVTTRGHRAPPPPPSVVHHGVPARLDEAILKLLSSDPADRAGAMPLLLELAEPRVEPLDLRAQVKTRSAPIQTTVGGPSTSRAVEVPAAAARVVIPAHDLERLDPAGRSAAAGLAGLPLLVVEALAEEGLPLVVQASTSSTVARREAEALATQTGLPIVAATSNPFAAFAIATTTLTLALLLGAVGVVLTLLVSLPLAVGAYLLSALTLLLGAFAWSRTRSAGGLHSASRRSARRAAQLQESLDPGGVLATSWRHLAEVRSALATADLPTAAASDMRGALKDLERRLQGLGEVGRTAREALAGLDAPRLRTRLAALERRAATDPEARAERDQVARTLADLEAVQSRQAALVEEARRIDATLDEVRTVLARVADTGDLADAALDDLVRAATLSSASVSEPLAEPAPRPPPRRLEEP